MTRQQIFDKLGTIFRESAATEVDWGAVTEESTIASLGFDSLAVLDLLFGMEEEFGFEVNPKDVLKIDTVGSMVTFLEERLAS